GRQGDAEDDSGEGFAVRAVRAPDVAVGDEDGPGHAVAACVLGDAPDVRPASRATHTDAQLSERDVRDQGGEEMDGRVDEVLAVEDGTVESAPEVADAAAHVDVDVHALPGALAARHGAAPRVEQGRRAEGGQHGRAAVEGWERRHDGDGVVPDPPAGAAAGRSAHAADQRGEERAV